MVKMTLFFPFTSREPIPVALSASSKQVTHESGGLNPVFAADAMQLRSATGLTNSSAAAAAQPTTVGARAVAHSVEGN